MVLCKITEFSGEVRDVMAITSIFSSIGMMAVIIIFGVLIGRKLTVGDDAKRLIMMIIINISVPAIIINGVINAEISDSVLSNMFLIFVIAIFFNLFGIGIGLLLAKLFKFETIQARKIAILSGLGNTGFIGIPLCAQIFGPTGGLLAALYDAGLDIVIFTVVIMMLQEQSSFSMKQVKALINLPIIAIIVAIFIAAVGFEPAPIIKDLTSRLAALASPLAMIYVGLLIPTFIRKKVKISFRYLSVPLCLKLIVLPIIAMVLLFPISLATEVKQVVFIQVSMPTFMLATVLFAKYANDEETAVFTTIYSTLLSLLTIPLMAYFASLLL